MIDEETYLNHYFYPGKELSDEEVLLLKRAGKDKKASDYLSSLLLRGRYTYHQLFEKLEKKFPSLSEKEIKSLLSPYVADGLIDDKSYAVDFASSRAEQAYGSKAILAELKKRGVNEEIRSSPEVKEAISSAPEALSLYVDSLYKRKSSIPNKKKKEMISASLLRRGFSYSEIESALKEKESEKTEEEREAERKEETSTLKKEAKKCYNSLTHTSSFLALDKRERRKKMMEKLLRKGFAYEEVVSELDNKEEYSEL